MQFNGSMRSVLLLALVVTAAACASAGADAWSGKAGEWTPLFNGRDLSGWKVPEGDNGHWRAVGAVIDYDALSEATGDKNLWTEREYGDFVLRLDWRLKEYAGLYEMPTILPDGSYQTDASGNVIRMARPNADSGIYLRGTSKAQINLWAWPVGSGVRSRASWRISGGDASAVAPCARELLRRCPT